MLNPASPVYLVMRNHGRFGMEGICHPESSRQNIIDEVWSDRTERKITQVFELADGLCVDVTEEFQIAAGIEMEVA